MWTSGSILSTGEISCVVACGPRRAVGVTWAERRRREVRGPLHDDTTALILTSTDSIGARVHGRHDSVGMMFTLPVCVWL